MKALSAIFVVCFMLMCPHFSAWAKEDIRRDNDPANLLDISEVVVEIVPATCNGLGKVLIDEATIDGGDSPYSFLLVDKLKGAEAIFYHPELELAAGSYDLIVIDAAGQRSLVAKKLLVTKQEDCDHVVISSNGDGTDDTYFIPDTGNARIYDRYGMLKAEFETPSCWDATDSNGSYLPMGNYIMLINEKTINITVIR